MNNQISQRQNTEANRIWSFDFFRAYGCLAIVLLHVVAAWRDDPTNSASFYSVGEVRLIFDNAIVPLLVRMVVPFFFMMSGALFLDPNRVVTNDSIRRHLIKILVNLGFFGYFMALIELVVSGRDFQLQYLYMAIVNLLQEETWSHLWYLYATIGLYLITPLLRPWIAKASDGELKTSICIAFILFSIIPTLDDLLNVQLTQFGLFTPRGALLWYLFGYCLMAKYDVLMTHKKTVYCALLLGGVLTAVFGIISYRWEITLIQPYHIWIVIYSAALYLVLLHNGVIENIAKMKIVTLLSSCSLVVYIIHPVFLNAIYKGIHLYPDRFQPIVGEFIIWVIVAVAAVLCTLIVKKLPVLRKYM